MYREKIVYVSFDTVHSFRPEKEMGTHSSTLAWKIPWMEEHDKLQSMGSQTFTFIILLSMSGHSGGKRGCNELREQY